MNNGSEYTAKTSRTATWCAGILTILAVLLLAGCTGEAGEQAGKQEAQKEAKEECANYEPEIAKSEMGKLGRIAFSNNGDIYTMNLDGSDETNLTAKELDGDFFNYAPAWSRDGKRIAFASDREGRDDLIHVMNADGTGLRRLNPGHPGVESPSWSPDGEKIAYTADTGQEHFVLMVMNSDGTDSTTVRRARVPGYINYWDWSPDGSRVVFTEDRSPTGYGQTDTYAMNPDGTCVNRLTEAPGNDLQATWSPDGEKILFGSDREGGGIYTMKPDGTDEARILKAPQELSEYAPVEEFRSAWSPDGKRIVWVGKYDGDTGSKIYVMNADGSGLNAIHSKLEMAPYVDWQPVR